MKNAIFACAFFFLGVLRVSAGPLVYTAPDPVTGAAISPASIVVGDQPKSLASGSVLTSSGSVVIQSTVSTAAQGILILRNNAGTTTGVFTQGGRLGIGTSAPNDDLDIAGSVDLIVGASDGVGFDLISSDANDAGLRVRRSANDTGACSLQVNNAADTTIALCLRGDGGGYLANAGGSLGIGTTSPATKLHIDGVASAPELRLDSNVNGDNVSLGSWTIYAQDQSGNEQQFLGLEARSFEGSDTLEESGFLVNAWNAGAWGPRVALKGANVGIGTTTPGAVVEISTTSAASPSIGISPDFLVADPTGNAGMRSEIGMGYRASGNTYVPAYIGYVQNSGAGQTKGDLYFATRDATTDSAPTERLYIKSDGNIGIGATNPGTKLNVIGDAIDISSATSSGTTMRFRGAHDTAPATCNIGSFYIDTSGAACFCDSANNWIEMGTGAGDCT